MNQPLFGKRANPQPEIIDVTDSKEAFIKGAATTNQRNVVEIEPVIIVEAKPLSRLEKLLVELEELVKEENAMWEESGKKPRTLIDSFTKLPVVDKKLDIMFEDAKAMFSSKSKFISFLIEDKYEAWKKEKEQ
ncbi:hypothetical protein [Pseudomonas haemolytica]|jgi:hypothetical protein|uniref:Uncharacterized protein n=1 Tax=Pseudomonas haemolytica TaxID=2600065 RepID=A0ABS1H0B8_9PSED|nr:hypothetical protein [Pseudomonas haemolytica]MBK3462678.1 hypothetical protein [Pseudomonas haemolytica]